ncbi:hypothetical protein L9F63_016810, partial [Diploptera punctata]
LVVVNKLSKERHRKALNGVGNIVLGLSDRLYLISYILKQKESRSGAIAPVNSVTHLRSKLSLLRFESNNRKTLNQSWITLNFRNIVEKVVLTEEYLQRILQSKSASLVMVNIHRDIIATVINVESKKKDESTDGRDNGEYTVRKRNPQQSSKTKSRYRRDMKNKLVHSCSIVLPISTL